MGLGDGPNLDIFEVKWLLAVLAVERPLWALPLIMALLFTKADLFFAGGAGDDHELALPLMIQLWKKNSVCMKLKKNSEVTHLSTVWKSTV